MSQWIQLPRPTFKVHRLQASRQCRWRELSSANMSNSHSCLCSLSVVQGTRRTNYCPNWAMLPHEAVRKVALWSVLQGLRCTLCHSNEGMYFESICIARASAHAEFRVYCRQEWGGVRCIGFLLFLWMDLILLLQFSQCNAIESDSVSFGSPWINVSQAVS